MLTDVVGLAAGSSHTILVLKDGSAWSTSLNSDDASNWFIRVVPSDVTFAAAGTGYSMVLKQDGSVWGTGANWKGQLGDQSRTTRRSFVLVQIFPDGGKAIATGG